MVIVIKNEHAMSTTCKPRIDFGSINLVMSSIKTIINKIFNVLEWDTRYENQDYLKKRINHGLIAFINQSLINKIRKWIILTLVLITAFPAFYQCIQQSNLPFLLMKIKKGYKNCYHSN